MTSNGAQPEIQTGMLKSHPHVPQQQVDRAGGQEKLQNIYNIQNRLAGGQEKLQMIERVSVNFIDHQPGKLNKAERHSVNKFGGNSCSANMLSNKLTRGDRWT